jgi:hypothetical protein
MTREVWFVAQRRKDGIMPDPAKAFSPTEWDERFYFVKQEAEKYRDEMISIGYPGSAVFRALIETTNEEKGDEE